MKKLNFKSNQSGFTMIELAIAFAVIAVVLLAVIPGAGLLNSGKIHSAARTIHTLEVGSKSYLAAGNTNYTGISLTTLKTANHIPNGFTGNGPWGSGAYTIAANAGDSSLVDVALTEVPATEGATLITLFTNTAASVPVYDAATNTLTLTF